MPIIAVSNQKGGVGKTTTTVNLAAALAMLGKRVLLVDMDPQGNATTGLGIHKDELSIALTQVLLEQVTAQQACVRSPSAPVDVLPSNGDLVSADVALMSQAHREMRLKNALASISANYDWILIDCPPSLNLLTLNALTSADGVLVPVQCEYYALEGLAALLGTIDNVRQTVNPKLAIAGLLRTMYDKRNKLAQDVSNELLTHFGPQVLASVVPRNVRLAEAPSFGQSIFEFDAASTGAAAYLALAQELSRRRF
ncbi:MAG: ParA family protein [Thiotrichales bacterium]|jgi:chromosome partitioning protein|nr:ParA family protein [Thiotrichales bacterium]